MTIPAWGWLVLRRVAGKRLPHSSVERKCDSTSVQTATLFGTMVVRLESVTKIR